MKATITDVIFKKEYKDKFGTKYSFQIKYDDQVALYSSKSKEQKKFIPGEEAEFTEETRTYTDKNTGDLKEFTVIKPVYQQRQSNYGKALGKEQSRYSGFAVSYAKDLVVNGRIDIKELSEYSTVLFDLMVALDKSLES